MIVCTPLFQKLKSQGDEVYLLTSDQGKLMMAHDPNVDKIIHYQHKSIPDDKLVDFFHATQKLHECDRMINLCESIEVALALFPDDPQFMYPKEERRALCDKNYYDYTMAWGGFPESTGLHGTFYPTP